MNVLKLAVGFVLLPAVVVLAAALFGVRALAGVWRACGDTQEGEK